MSEIKFNGKFFFSLSLVETDDISGMMCMRLDLSINFSTGKMSLSKDYWILYDSFDIFLDELKGKPESQLTSFDVSLIENTNDNAMKFPHVYDMLYMTIHQSTNFHRLELKFSELTMTEDNYSLQISNRLSLDESGILRESFLNFPKWW